MRRIAIGSSCGKLCLSTGLLAYLLCFWRGDEYAVILDMVMRAHLVTASDIAQWANTLQARALLPKLIRKLVRASGIPFSEIRFASDEGIQEPDWDGFLDSPTRTTYIPKGKSGWEVSSKKDVRGKADDDMSARLKAIPAKERMGITYVCVTTRRWKDKKSWERAHNAKGKKRWRKVIAYDATDLETWLEFAPDSAHVWLSEVLGKRPQEVMSIEAAWSAWADVAKRALTPRLIKAGRNKQVDELIGQLNGPARVILIKGETREEAQAFALATILGMPDAAKEAAAARTLIVKSRAAWDLYSDSVSPMILVPMFDNREGVEQAARSGHTVIIPMDRSDTVDEATMQLPPITRSEATEALKEMGCKSDHLRALAFTGHKSLMSLRRQLAEIPSVYEPRWANKGATDVLVPALLAGSWSEETDRSEGDRKVLETLSGRSYEELRSELLNWVNEPDTPIRLVGNTWYVVSQEDLWAQLRKYITAKHLQLFGQVVIDVLKRPHPSFDLAAKERHEAPLRGLHFHVSGDLLRGLVESMAFMGARGKGIKLADGTTIEYAPARILHDVFSAANEDWKIWASLSHQLPAFAEAAPEVFMKAVGDGLKMMPSPLAPLFVQEEDPFFGRSYHIGLIWALQTLAWRSEYLALTIDLLAALVPLDPLKGQKNRPLDSLYHILQPWVQNSNSTVEDRLKIMDGLRRRRPSEAYDLFIQTMPSFNRSTVHNTHVPRWRDWPSERRGFWRGEDVNMTLNTIGTWLIEDTANNPDRCVQLCDCLDQASRPFFKKVMKYFSENDLANWSGEQRTAVWDELRDLHAHHATYRHQPSSMPDDLLRLLRTQMHRYEPMDPQLRYRWLFTGHHRMPGERVRDYQEVQSRLAAEGATAILSNGGVGGIQKMTLVAEKAGLLGDACGRIDLGEADELALLDWSVGNADSKVAWFGAAFVTALQEKHGWDWEDAWVGRSEWGRWPMEKRGAFFAALPFEPATWGRVALSNADTESAYWRTCIPRGSMDPEQSLFAAERFLHYGKPLRSLTAALRHGRGVKSEAPTELLTLALEACVRTYADEQEEVWMSDYTITEAHEIIAQRTDADRQRVALIEWQFFNLLERKELVLYAEMEKDPTPFADILSFMHRSIEDPERQPTEHEGRLAARAREVLRGWKKVPALNDDGTMSDEVLETWYRKAVSAVLAKGKMWSDYPFGEKLKFAPADPDGTWPCAAVRSLIEKLQSDDLERGVEIEVYNSRGVTSADGGHSERVLSQRYADFAKAVELTYPRTAAMLRRIADDFTRSARFWETRQETQQAVDYHMG